MVWVRLDDHIDEHPKLIAVGPLGLALFVTGLAYCNRNLTDGYIPKNMIYRLIDTTDADSLVDAESVTALLVEHGLWEKVDNGYRIHDFHEYQPTREQVLKERKATRERVARFRQKKRGNALGNAVSNDDVTLLPYPYPDPVPSTTSTTGVTPLHQDPVVKDKMGTLLSAFGRCDSPTVLDEFAFYANDLSIEEITTAISECRRDGVRPWPANIAKRVPRYLKRPQPQRPSRNGHKPTNESTPQRVLDPKQLGAFRE